MAISQSDAQKLLDNLEKSKQKPELILTDLFIHGISGINFLYQVDIDEKHIYDHCKKQLGTLPVFQDCIIKQNSFEFTVYLKSEYEDGYLNDPIAKINANIKSFALPHGIIKMYQDALDNPLPEEPEKEELSEFWQVFRDFSSMKRPKVALQVFCQSRGNIFQKIRDSLYMLYVPVGTVVSAYEREKGNIRRFNERNAREYQTAVEQQQQLRAAAPEKIRIVRKKETEISAFLMGIGYSQEMKED